MTWAILFFVILLSAPLLLVTMISVDENIVVIYSNIAQVISVILAGISGLVAAGAFPSNHAMRKVWRLIGIGLLLWAIGAILYASYPLLHDGQDPPVIWYSDFGYLLMYPFVILAFILFRQYLQARTPVWGIVVAASIFWLALVIAVWLNLARLGESDSVLTYLVSLCYMLGDPLLLGSVALLTSVLGKSVDARPWWFVLVGFVMFYITNVLYTYLALQERYTSGNPIDIGWILGFGLIAMAAMMTRAIHKNDSALIG